MHRYRLAPLVRILAAATALAMPAPQSAHAQMVVTDPLNLIQTALSAARALEQVSNQVTQITNQIRQLENDARNLTRLGERFAPDLLAQLREMDRLIDETRSIALRVNETRAALDTLFSGDYQGTDVAVRARMAASQIDAARSALQSSLLVQAKATEQLRSDHAVLERLSHLSASAPGALSAQQATNEFLAFQAQQAMRLQQLLIAESRAAALEHARQMEVRAQGAAQRDHFLSGARTAHPDERPWD